MLRQLTEQLVASSPTTAAIAAVSVRARITGKPELQELGHGETDPRRHRRIGNAAGIQLPPPGRFAILASAALTWIALRYAHWRRMLDQPGHRACTRSRHRAAVVSRSFWPRWWQACICCRCRWARAFAIGLLLVRCRLDRRPSPRSVRVRIVVHFLAALLFVATLWPLQTVDSCGMLCCSGFAVLASPAITSENFMDGSNGLGRSQACGWRAGSRSCSRRWCVAMCAVCLVWRAVRGVLPSIFRAHACFSAMSEAAAGFAWPRCGCGIQSGTQWILVAGVAAVGG